MSKRLKAGVCYHGPQWKVNRIEPCSVTGGVLLFIFFSRGVAGIKNGVYLWGQTNTHTTWAAQ